MYHKQKKRLQFPPNFERFTVPKNLDFFPANIFKQGKMFEKN